MKNFWNKYTDMLGHTIFHPQFIMLSMTKVGVDIIKKLSNKNKTLLDIGCGRMPYRKTIETKLKKYVGLDYKPVAKLYKSDSIPDVYGDAHKLPYKDNVFDITIMLQSLEYFHDPMLAIKEAGRVLKKGGYIVVTSPFMYPLHDIPFDRFRFTDTQLCYFLEESKFSIKKIETQGGFFDFFIQTFLIFWFKSAKKNIFLLLFTPILVVPLNILDLILKPLQRFFYASRDFPLNYLVVARKI